ncbi:unnamed protein product [Anisakis simplex]|uniref:Uncharacterized protein n=1 Tax=Anisakis simplex TaxID=6269 RepID=A0A3P6PRG0_ANISI|nr:unnamed protein product [Anisakis simplex]
MLRFILPLIQPYAVDFTSKTSALSDEAIRLLSYIMSVAPWKRCVIILSSEFFADDST